MCSFVLNLLLIMLVVSTEAAYCTALCWTVGHSKSEAFCYCSTLCGKTGTTSAPLHSRGLLWALWGPLMHRNIDNTATGQTRMGLECFHTHQTMAVHQVSPLNSRPTVCFSGASVFLPFFFVVPTLYPSHFLASHVLFLFFLHIPNFFLRSSGFSFLWPPGDLSCALWLPLSDVAHHRAQHALNKPSNPKTPQGTILFTPPPTCGCQPLPSVSQSRPVFSVSLLHSATGCYCFIINAWF